MEPIRPLRPKYAQLLDDNRQISITKSTKNAIYDYANNGSLNRTSDNILGGTVSLNKNHAGQQSYQSITRTATNSQIGNDE